ncbi:hypothetical protein GCM10023232_19240 [Sphingosinicella ginsenosidimutans]|uniref:DUF3035 domain-containing protein n=1 Tax=Allosphingosinicella ginsenosidimutans TaxID=1176539 RepID=A0A5C6TRY4_9SPHN|nr:DUF3035 domain-containing protein [Sphingosinicella ginsenosidimutans]TXC62959.1 DUF3035 domain-containing protein [Sphingosinicella ginsenosidimutans]
MRLTHIVLAGSAALVLAGCAGGGPFHRQRPDEFAVARNAPLVVPPDFALAPPRPGQPDAGSDPHAQALQALFGGPAPRAEVERNMLQVAGGDQAVLGARSVAGDSQTTVVNRGTLVQTIMQLPEGDGREASVTTPQPSAQ